jgi:hypothetical protein
MVYSLVERTSLSSYSTHNLAVPDFFSNLDVIDQLDRLAAIYLVGDIVHIHMANVHNRKNYSRSYLSDAWKLLPVVLPL